MAERSTRAVVLAGSLREASYNKGLARLAAAYARDQGAEVELIDLREYTLPFFDEDLERTEGPPANAVRLKQLFACADWIVIASPEYNGSISGVLKNTIDWLSRPAPGEPRLHAFTGKVVTLLAASTGDLGGVRGLLHLRVLLGGLDTLVSPTQMTLPRAQEAFDAEGELRDARARGRLERALLRGLELARK